MQSGGSHGKNTHDTIVGVVVGGDAQRGHDGALCRDVFVIPAGTGHQFTRIDDHTTCRMVRIDPDKVAPLMDAADWRRYLEAAGP